MKASDWISVEDSLPQLCYDVNCIKFSEEVLLCVYNDRILTATLVCDKSDNTMFWSASQGGSYYLKEGSYWQPIVFPKMNK